jgi:hypothetical protein
MRRRQNNRIPEDTKTVSTSAVMLVVVAVYFAMFAGLVYGEVSDPDHVPSRGTVSCVEASR